MRFLTSFNLNAKEQLQLISGSFLSLCSSYSTKYKWARDLVEWRTKRKERDTKKNNSEKRASGMRASFSLCFLCAFLSFAGLISCFHYKLTKRKRYRTIDTQYIRVSVITVSKHRYLLCFICSFIQLNYNATKWGVNLID